MSYYQKNIFRDEDYKEVKLTPEKVYEMEGEEGTYTGEILMKAGINIQNPWGDFKGRLIHLTEV